MTLRRLVPRHLAAAGHPAGDTGRVHPDEPVVTGEAVALELRLASAGSRGIAAMIDLAIVYVALIVLLITVAFAGPGTNSAVQSTVLIVGLIACTLGYPVAFETLWHGRTLGKAAMGLRVVRDDGGPIRFRQAFVRGLAAVFLEKLGLTLGLLALILIVAGASKKRLGDHLAGTIVLQERVPGRLEAPVAMPAPLAGWAASLDLSAVDDALALRMRQFLARAGEFTPDARAGLERQLATEVVAKVGAPPPHTPGWAIISAVLAERRRRAFATQAAALPPPPYVPYAPVPQPYAAPYQPPALAPADLAPPTADGFAPPA
jgi:uncharacterized RDD family membrane protein YckC